MTRMTMFDIEVQDGSPRTEAAQHPQSGLADVGAGNTLHHQATNQVQPAHLEKVVTSHQMPHTQLVSG